jgi:hypothetical protein
MPHMNVLNKLAAHPIPHDRYKEYIREVLKGFPEEFITICIIKFEPNKVVRFTVLFPDEKR